MPFPADEEVGDDLRNMVWKGHYLGYGPADVMLHVPVDNRLMNDNPQGAHLRARITSRPCAWCAAERSIPRFDRPRRAGRQAHRRRKGVDRRHADAGRREWALSRPGAHLPQRGEALLALKGRRTRCGAGQALRNRSGDARRPGLSRSATSSFQRLPRSGWAVGMAVRKDDEDSARRLQAALNEMAASGELKACSRAMACRP
jgi:hypothetical protein